ncbi:hypothetical protein Hanom_Chr06g00572191 [Helianthus anomalus]
MLCANGDNQPNIFPKASLHSPARTGSLALNPIPFNRLLSEDLMLLGNME